MCRITADVAFGGLVWCSWLQLAGMVAGYNSAAPAGQELTHTDFLFMNSQVRRFMLLLRGAIRWGSHTPPHAPLLTRLVWSMSRRAILATFNKPCCLTACETTRLTCRLLMYVPHTGCCRSKGAARVRGYHTVDRSMVQVVQHELAHTHCSVLLKWTGNMEDLYAGHTMWWSYYAMLRVYKTYHMGDFTVMFSSYPGLLSSTDDIYQVGCTRHGYQLHSKGLLVWWCRALGRHQLVSSSSRPPTTCTTRRCTTW